jgi:predicted transcriptional regulator
MATPVNDLYSRLLGAMGGGADTVPTGWLDRRDMAERLGTSYSNVGRLLDVGVTSGILERKTFRIVTKGGIKPVPHYREKK